MRRESGEATLPFRIRCVGPREWLDRIETVIDGITGVDATFHDDDPGRLDASDRTGDPVDCLLTATPPPSDFAADGPVPPVRVVAPVGCDPDDAARPDAERTADATWTVPLDGTGPGVTGETGLRRVIERERDASIDRVDAAGFRATAGDPDRFVATLDRDGTVSSLNAAAERLLDAPEATLVGRRLWAIPGLSRGEVRRRVQEAVRRAGEGEYASFEATVPGAEASTRVAFRVQPTRSTAGAGLVVHGTVRTELERLETELRESEELHRVTLNNMTETVLVTNDDGEFTYVCPNVHFIFGYTAEEIHELETIDELLGSGIYDPAELRSEGVLTNIEWTATDKAGEEHTLLVTVREVAIRDGSVLYSCRDVTARKQRERALTQLQETTRELLYAETDAEVAAEIVAGAETALADAGIAVHRFDETKRVLYPIVASDVVRRALGEVPEHTLDDASPATEAFLEGRTVEGPNAGRPELNADQSGANATRPGSNAGRSGANANRSEAGVGRSGPNPFATLGGFAAIPMGEHGVLLVIAPDDELTAVDAEVGELLAATAEAAFDRLARERALHERDERLRERNERLSEANAINEIIRDVDRALVDADDRSTIEEAICARLTEDDRFAFAWVGERTARDRSLRPRAWAPDDGGYLDEISLEIVSDPAAEPSVRAAADREPVEVANVAALLHDAEWGRAAASRNLASILSVPLSYDDVSLGTLSVYAAEPGAFSETARDVFTELGRTIGAAINAVQRKEALQSDVVTRLTYRLRDGPSVLLRLAIAHDCRLSLESVVVDDDRTVSFVSVRGASPEAVLEEALSFVDVTGGEVIRASGDEGLISLETTAPPLAVRLADHGVTRDRFTATPDGIELVIDAPGASAVRAVDELLAERFETVDLRSQRRRTSEHGGGDPLDAATLTPRQEEVVRVAYHSGYFDADRDLSGRDVAETLGISHTAFYDHVRRVERKLFAALLESPDEGTSDRQ